MKAMLQLLALCLTLVTPALLPADQRPPIHIRPELYLGWTAQQKRPAVRKLPWMLKISLRGTDTARKTVAGPVHVNTREEFVGAGFASSQLAPGTNTAFTLETLDFAAQVVPEGANLINLRCYVKIRIAGETQSHTYQTMTTLECRPGRETMLAEFPDLKLLITADWLGPVIME